MIRNYFKIAFRNLVKNKLYSLVNIFGLALGMAACFFIFQYVHFESGYDRFNKNADQLYRVTISYTGSFANSPTTATNHPATGPAMKAAYPEVKDFVRVVSASLFLNTNTLSYKDGIGEDKTFNEENVYVADASFFNVFSYPLVYGNRNSCLSEARTTVISEPMAERYFGKSNPIGKMLVFNGDLPLKVTGVFKNVREDSHLKFNMLISFETLGPKWGYDEWTYPEFYNYVVLAPGTDPKKLEAKLPALINKNLAAKMKELNFGCALHLQPVNDIHLKSNLRNEAEINGSEKEIYFLSLIGVFILVIAWINYINLSTAKSMERAREVGLRKVVGAARTQLIFQFLLESFILNLIALLIAALIVIVCNPLFSRFIGKNISEGFFTIGLGTMPSFWLSVIAVFLCGAILVGAYPALILSSYKPVAVLKGLVVKSNTGISLRRALVSFQFILSIILIAATILVFKQLAFMRNGDLGYKNDQVLLIKSPAIGDSTIVDHYRYFKTELTKNPSVVNAATSSDVPGQTIRYRNSVRKASQDKSFNFTSYYMEIDENFINTYDVKVIKGRNFYNTDSSMIRENNNTKVLINEAVASALGYKNPEEALNQNIVFTLGQNNIDCQVVGIVKNYHQRSFKENYDPILYYFPAWVNWKYISVHINTANLTNDLASIEKLYKSSFPGNPFEYFFQDEFFNKQYITDQRLGNVFGLFAVLAIAVACLGLLGLSSFVIKLRTKEIGIRKVLGASLSSILVLFSKDFIRLVIIASLIATPVIYFTAHNWLANYAFHIPVSWFIFVIPPVLLLVIALGTVCMQSLRAALANPVKSLRSE
jgi:putative ABC transport system permease protein